MCHMHFAMANVNVAACTWMLQLVYDRCVICLLQWQMSMHVVTNNGLHSDQQKRSGGEKGREVKEKDRREVREEDGLKNTA